MADEIPSTYAAVFHLKVSSNDVHLVCGQPVLTQGEGEEPGVGLKWTHSIAMSPQAFKQLAIMLMANLPEYEKSIGEIRVASPTISAAPAPAKASAPAKRSLKAKK